MHSHITDVIPEENTISEIDTDAHKSNTNSISGAFNNS